MKNPYPPIQLVCYVASVVFALSQLTCAQCPELCDGNENTALGQSALVNNSTGMNNTAVGFQALQNSNADGNTATGYQALMSNTSGTFNTAYGQQALSSSSAGGEQTALGAFALASITNGYGNTAVGYQTLSHSTSVFNNTAVGWNALTSNTSGSSDTAVGSNALSSSTIGWDNVAVGDVTLTHNTTGSSNTAVGTDALYDNTTGSWNTAVGQGTLVRNVRGNSNTAIGYTAGYFLTTGSFNIDIANGGVAGESRTIRIGEGATQRATYIAGIRGATVAGGVGVIIDSAGHLGTIVSSERFKAGIKPMDKASEAVLSLQPVTFHYRKELDPDSIAQFGLVAEQVEKVNPDLVARDEQGKPYTVRYEAVNAMLLNEFLKEHRKTEKQGSEICDLKATVGELKSQLSAVTASLKAQAEQIQKVSNQLRTHIPAPRVAANE
jgi:hypothetical protein